jgi:DNA-binding CsgD family transcriptional regulator
MTAREIPLFERGRELDEIASTASATAAGNGAVLLIEGEAGIGKTRLLEAARELAAEQGLTSLAARGSQLERGFAFGVVRQLFQAPLAALPTDTRQEALSGAAALTASLLMPARDESQPRSGPDVFSLLHGLHWLCANLATTQPLLLAVDDLQWADENSLRFLAYLAGRVDELPVFVIATLRSGEPDSPEELLRELRTQPAARSLRPQSLSLDATVSVIRSELRSTAETGFCAACHESTAGNPLLLSELLRALEIEGVEALESQRGLVYEIGAKGVPERLLARISQISPEAVEVARAVATLEPHATLRRTAAVSGVGGEQAAVAAHALVEAGVLADDEALAFVHPLLRSAVEGGMTKPQRSVLASRAAEVHWNDGSEREIVASHLLEAGGEPPGWAIQALTAAADAALSRGAPEPAVTYLRFAAELAPDDEARHRLRTLLGAALLRATNAEGIELLLEERAASADPLHRAALTHDLAVPLVIRDRADEAVQILEQSIEELGEGDFELSLTLRADLMQALFNGPGGHRLRAEFDALSGLTTKLTGATLAERLALQSLALAAAIGLDTAPTALKLAKTALGDEQAMRAASRVGLPLSWACAATAIAGDPKAALEAWRPVVETMRRRGSAFGTGMALGARAMVRLSRGELAEAEADLVELQMITGLPQILELFAIAGRVMLERERGRADLGMRAIADAGFTGDIPKALPALCLQTERGLTRLEQGRAEDAVRDLDGVATVYEVAGGFGPDFIPARLRVSLAIQATGDTSTAVAAALETEAWARETENPRFIGEATRVLGLVDAGAGIDALRRSVELLATTQFRLDLARALVELGAALRRANERKGSRDPLREGMELAHRCGATALEERARTELEATGARPRSVIVTGVESLTPSERRVAQLAVEGMTNREIAQMLYVTSKTVETHLRHCYQKLEISGRRELAEVLADR